MAQAEMTYTYLCNITLSKVDEDDIKTAVASVTYVDTEQYIHRKLYLGFYESLNLYLYPRVDNDHNFFNTLEIKRGDEVLIKIPEFKNNFLISKYFENYYLTLSCSPSMVRL